MNWKCNTSGGAGRGDRSCDGAKELFTQINTLRQLLNAERPERRNLWKVKIDELGHEAQFLSTTRDESRTSTSTSENGTGRETGGSSPSSAHDDLLEAEDSYARSGNQVDRGVP